VKKKTYITGLKKIFVKNIPCCPQLYSTYKEVEKVESHCNYEKIYINKISKSG